MSATEPAAWGRRSSDLGVITISGRWLALRAWGGSRGGYWPRVVRGAPPRVPPAPGDPNRRALGQQRGERQRLRVGPVDRGLGSVGQGLAPAVELFDELWMDREAVREREQLVAELAQRLGGDGGLDVGAGRAVELVLA